MHRHSALSEIFLSTPPSESGTKPTYAEILADGILKMNPPPSRISNVHDNTPHESDFRASIPVNRNNELYSENNYASACKRDTMPPKLSLEAGPSHHNRSRSAHSIIDLSEFVTVDSTGVSTNNIVPDQRSAARDPDASVEQLKEIVTQQQREMLTLTHIVSQLLSQNITKTTENEKSMNQEDLVRDDAVREKCHNVKYPPEGIHRLPPDWVSPFRGNPMSMLPTFNHDPSDKTECDRWLDSLMALAKEHQWSDSTIKQVMEAKLGPKAKTTYFSSLGSVREMTIEERLAEFRDIFSYHRSEDERTQSFFSCHQGNNEPVSIFKNRLMAASELLPSDLPQDPKSKDKLLKSQFRKGLLPHLKMELLKQKPVTFQQATAIALDVERMFSEVNNKSAKICMLEEDNNGQLMKELSLIKDHLIKTDEYIKKREIPVIRQPKQGTKIFFFQIPKEQAVEESSKSPNNFFSCDHCNRPEQHCVKPINVVDTALTQQELIPRRIFKTKARKFFCEICSKPCHTSSNCPITIPKQDNTASLNC